MNGEFLAKSKEETQNFAQQLAHKLRPGDFLAFYGELGSGKTTFIQGLAKGLGIKRRIISPTFIIVRHYQLEYGNFYHIDLYRTQTKHDLLGVGLDQIVKDRDNIVALEWAEKMGEMLPQKRIEIKCENLGGDKRLIKIRRYE